jgi:hypothetical protein
METWFLFLSPKQFSIKRLKFLRLPLAFFCLGILHLLFPSLGTPNPPLVNLRPPCTLTFIRSHCCSLSLCLSLRSPLPPPPAPLAILRWGLISGPCTCGAGTLPFEPHLRPFYIPYFLSRVSCFCPDLLGPQSSYLCFLLSWVPPHPNFYWLKWGLVYFFAPSPVWSNNPPYLGLPSS